MKDAWTVRKVPLMYDPKAVLLIDEDSIALCTGRGDGSPEGYDHMDATEARRLALALLAAAMLMEAE